MCSRNLDLMYPARHKFSYAVIAYRAYRGSGRHAFESALAARSQIRSETTIGVGCRQRKCIYIFISSEKCFKALKSLTYRASHQSTCRRCVADRRVWAVPLATTRQPLRERAAGGPGSVRHALRASPRACRHPEPWLKARERVS